MKCNSGCTCWALCPFSLGAAIGITSGLAVLIWTVYVLHYGPTPMMTQLPIFCLVALSHIVYYCHD